MNANTGKLLLCISLMTLLSTQSAQAGGISQGISRGNTTEHGAKDEGDGDGERKVSEEGEDTQGDAGLRAPVFTPAQDPIAWLSHLFALRLGDDAR